MLETKAGTWTIESTGELKAVVPAAGRAYCVEGLETDVEYTVIATLRIVEGNTASIIVFYTVSEADERYVEFILDAVNNKVKLDKVDGEARTNILDVAYTIDPNRTYACEVSASLGSDDKGVVTCSVNGVIVAKAEALATPHVAGKYGYACDGSADDYVQFSKRVFQKREHYTTVPVLAAELSTISFKELVGKDGTMQQYYDRLLTFIEGCGQFIDGETERAINFFQDKGLAIEEYHDGVGVTPPTGMYEFSEEQASWQERAAVIFTGQRPILSITSIHDNKAAIGESDDWDEITEFRWYTHGEIIFSASKTPARGRKNVRIRYVAGYTKTPTDIQMACTRLIVNLIHKQISDKTATFISFSRPSGVNFAMPDVYTPDIKAVLKRYKLLGFGEM